MPQYVPPRGPRQITAGPLTAGEAAALTAKLADGRGLDGLWATPPLMVSRGTNGSAGLYLAGSLFDTGGAFSLNVCGSPVEPENECGECELGPEDEELIEDVAAIIFEPCDFVTVEIDDARCGGSGSGSGSSDLGKAAHVRLGGKTEEVTVLLGAKWCPYPVCDVVTWNRTLCFRNGLYIGHIDEEEPAC